MNIQGAEDRRGDSRQKQRRQSNEGTDQTHYRYGLSCLPNPVRRLVSDMLDNETCSRSSDGVLFCHDESVALLSDVVCDLQQMVDNSKSFLHDSLLLRWEPVIPDSTLYGRENELNQCLEVADAVSKSTVIMEHSQSAIMISGRAGTGKSRLKKEVRNRLENEGWQCIHVKFGQEVQPLIQISSAFDRFLVDNIVCGPDDTNDADLQRFKADIVKVFGAEGGIEVLVQLVPTLRKF